MSEIKAIIFDCDGTLVDSEPAHYLSWQYAAQEFGGDLQEAEYYQLVGKTAERNASFLAQKIGSAHDKAILQKKREHYRRLQQEGHPSIAHTVEFVHRLAQEKEKYGLQLGIASASTKEEILANLRQLGIESYFSVILSGSDDLQHYKDPEGVNKPKPYIYLESAKKLSLHPHQCVVIEDSHAGVMAGVSAGCLTLAVPNSFTRHHDFSHAHLTLASFADLSVSQFIHMTSELSRKVYAER